MIIINLESGNLSFTALPEDEAASCKFISCFMLGVDNIHDLSAGVGS